MTKLSPNHAWRLFLLVAAIVLGLAWTIATLHVHEVREEIGAAARHRVQALARTHAEHVQLTLTIADEVLRSLRHTAESDSLAAYRREAARLSGPLSADPINRVTLIGADGWTIVNYIDGREQPPVNLADRDHFKALLRDRDDHVVVSEPVRSKTSGEWIVLLARPILKSGKFTGAVVVGFPAARMGRFFESIDTDKELLTLLSPGGRIIARSANIEALAGQPVALPQPAGGSSGAPFLYASPLDRVERLMIVHELPDWGLRILSGVDTGRMAQEVAAHARVAFLPAALLTLLLIPASLLIRYASRAQRAADSALQAETRRSRTVFETMGDGILLLDERGIVTFANARAAAWLPDACGHPVGEVLRAADFAIVNEDGRALTGADPLAERCLQAGDVIDDAWLKRGDEEAELWLALRAHPFRDTDGAVLGATLTLSDRSEEHERLMESALSANILESMHDAVMITDAHGRILRVNPAFTELTGYAGAEVVGHSPALFKSERHDAEFFKAMWTALNETGNWSGRVWNRRKSGEEHCVWHAITSVRDSQGRIARFIAVSRDITEQEARESELWHHANFDSLTGLANRARFLDRLAQTLANAQRDGQGFAVCYLDLDRFKPVNDTLGHAAGDALLRQVAQRMRSVLREEDTLARIGGDEFALLLPRIRNVGDTSRVATKIIDLVNAPFDLPEGAASIGISIGIALFPEHGSDAAQLCEAADRALYDAKASGRDCWRFAQRNEPDRNPA